MKGQPSSKTGMTKKGVSILLLAVLIASPLAACGKRAGQLDAPEGSTYPRQYPPAR